MKCRGTSFTCNCVKSFEGMQRLTKSQSLFYVETRSQAFQDLLDQAKVSRLPSVAKVLRHAKARSQSLLYGETRSQVCRDLPGQVKASRLRSVVKFRRHAKPYQVSKPTYGETRSQTCQNLLDQAKANIIPSTEKVSKACKGSPSLKACL